MRLQPSFRQAAVVVALVIVTLGATGLVAGAGNGAAAASDGDAKQIGQVDIEITDEQVTVSDIHLSGSGLPTVDIEERTYTIHDASVTTDGFTVTINDRDYEFCSISIVLDDISVTVENVQIGTE